jgi:hypothetical protein
MCASVRIDAWGGGTIRRIKNQNRFQESLTMTKSWHFFAVRAATPSGFRWHWQKQGAKVPVTSIAFEFYFDCISNARDKGYAGPLPAGPKAPLQHLPTGPIDTQRAPVALPPSSNNFVMTVTAVSALDVRKRRTSERV